MKNRRAFLLSMTTAFVALALMVAPVIADELFGVATKVDVEGKKITVLEKDTDKEIIVTTNDDTEWVTKKGTMKVDLEKIEKAIEKSKERGAKGVSLKIEHEKGVASKIHMVPKKKAADTAPKNEQ